MKKIVTRLVLSYLRFFAKIALKFTKTKIIGIAGSVGKSSTKDALYAILQDHFRTKFTYGNSETGIPLGILGIEMEGYRFRNWLKILFRTPFQIFSLKETEYLIVEMGTDDPFPPKNMEYLLTIVKPDIAIFLNTNAAHTMQFEKALSEEEKNQSPEKKLDRILKKMAHEDGKIITKSNCGTAIYGVDNQYVAEEIGKFQKTHQNSPEYLTFGTDKKNTVHYGEYRVSMEETSFELFWKDQKCTFHFKNSILPLEYREVFAAATLAAKHLGLSFHQIETSLIKNFSLPKGRASLFKGIHDAIILDSSYNASASAVEAFLNLGSKLKDQTKKPFAFVFGDMRELGDEAKQEHERIAKKIAETVDHLYCTGPLTKKFIVEAFEKKTIPLGIVKTLLWFENSKLLGEHLKKYIPISSIVLFKGSQNGIFLEEAIKPILLDQEDEKKLCRQEKYWKK